MVLGTIATTESHATMTRSFKFTMRHDEKRDVTTKLLSYGGPTTREVSDRLLLTAVPVILVTCNSKTSL